MILKPDIILEAYCAGLFPMAAARHGAEIRWYDPDPRGVLPIAGLHVPKRLARTIRRKPYDITFDKDFAAVIRGCADTREDTWINDDIIALYTALHDRGFAHSVEAWHDGKLVGGVYGIAIGAAFFGESMFSTATDASKIALVYLVARLWRRKFTLFDTQFINPHLLQFGAHEIPRGAYKQQLAAALRAPADFNQSSGLSNVGAGLSSSGSASSLGAASGVFSVENSCDLDAALFLQSITQTS